MSSDKYDWFVHYISETMGVEAKNAKQIYSEIANDSSSQNTHTPKILLPIIHYLLEPWRGNDCAYRVFQVARAYGLPSVYPLGAMLQSGLAPSYVELLMKQNPQQIAGAKIIEQAANARWLAALAMNDLRIRTRAEGRNLSEEEQRALSDAWSLARRLLNSVDDWRKECNRYPQSALMGVALSAIRDTERVLREIANS